MSLFALVGEPEPTPLPPTAVMRPRQNRNCRPRAALFSMRRETPTAPADRFRWRADETLGKYLDRVSNRRVRRDELPKDVRRVKGGAYQSRPWIGPARDANVNLGLFHPEDYSNDRDAAISAAARAAREFKKRLAGPPMRDIWEVIQELQRSTRFGLPVVPPHVLPPRVRRMSGGGYGVRGHDGEVFATLEEAWTVAKADFYAA